MSGIVFYMVLDNMPCMVFGIGLSMRLSWTAIMSMAYNYYPSSQQNYLVLSFWLWPLNYLL
jgi:hypothetical protein